MSAQKSVRDIEKYGEKKQVSSDYRTNFIDLVTAYLQVESKIRSRLSKKSKRKLEK
jgi:hypothetical protein